MDVLTEQNVYANWIRNGLITTLVGLAFLGVERLFNSQNRNAFKLLGIYILLIAGIIFFFSTLISKNVAANLSSHTNYYHYFGYLLLFAIIGIIIAMFITY